MIHTSKFSRKLSLLATVAPLSIALAAPAFAQDSQQTGQQAPGPVTNTTANRDQVTDTSDQSGDVVVTGSIIRRRTDTETASPVTTLTAEALDQRGVSTVQDAIQTLSSNNGPALTNSFTANGAFAAGASAVSLRGLSTNSTLVLFDGLRAAYYPLADDGSRNFVDLNTIPDDIVEKIDVLRDGASASYGADAIAGVVNIITKKEFKGVGGRAEAGISQRGDASQYRLSLTAGFGDLDEKGIAAYVSGFYYKSDALMSNQRKYPYNSDDSRGINGFDADGNPGTGGNAVVGGLNGAGLYTQGAPTSSNFLVRPYDPTNTTVVAGSRYQALSNNNCGPGQIYTLNAADLAANPTAPPRVCQIDYTNAYGTINPNIERFGASGRATAKVGDTGEAYLELNFIQSRSSYTGFPGTVYGTAPTGINYPAFRTSGAGGLGTTNAVGSGILALPVYVCNRNGQSAVLVNGVATTPGGCTAANGTLNPNNPFAGLGQVARIIGRDLQSVTSNETRNRAYRAAGGISGNLTDDLTYDVSATAMHEDLRITTNGYNYIQHLIDVVADGTYNFANPSANSQAVIDYLRPENRTDDSSDQYQLQATLGYKLFDLPGGPLQVGVGGSVRYEAVDAVSANNDINGPTQRYFTLNAFGTSGHRRIYSAYGEVNAPVFDQLELGAAARYDKYSSGQSAFSPKFTAKFKPIRQIAVRGTYSRGFRIPSFGEANALPTTGYVTNGAGIFTDAYLAQYSTPGAVCSTTTFAQCPTYIRSGSYGLTTLASPNLKPEKSRNFTAGVIVEPMRNVSLTVDYYNIKKTGAITTPDTGSAVRAYYAGTAIDPSITVIPDATDVNFPAAKPRIAFVQSQLVNADKIKSEGIDFQANGTFHLFGDATFTTSLDASYILELSTTVAGVKQRYDGTLGNFNLTAGSGTPKWHGSWQNTLDLGDFSLTGVAYYFGGYDLSAQDQGDGYKDCGENPGYSPTGCHIPKYITVDLTAQIKVNDQFTFYGSVLNVADHFPPIDVVTYGATNYNPVQGGTGILGRYFKAGVKVGF